MITKDWKREVRNKWVKHFFVLPRKLDDGDTVWLEWGERRLVGWYGSRPELQWEYRTKDGRIGSSYNNRD